MRTISVCNQKGGAGKTTTAVNLAAALGEKGYRVLLMDLDPQASASAWLGVKEEGKGLLEVLTEGAPLERLIEEETSAKGVDVIPASAWLSNLERLLAGEPGAELSLREAVASLPDRWDFLLMDCPPTLGLLTVSALCAAKELFVPVEASAMAMAGLADLLKTVERVKDRLNSDLNVSGVLVCRVDARQNLSRDVLDHLRARFGDLVLQTFVRDSVRLRESWSFTQPITVYDPKGSGALDYRAVADEITKKNEGGVANG